MLNKTQAFVLRKYDFTESSFIVHFFSRDFGAVSLVAKGAKRPKSEFRGNLEILNLLEIEFVRKEGSDLGALRRIELIDSAFSLFSKMEASKILFAISEILSKAVVEGQNEEEIFRLTKASVEALKNGVEPKWMFNYFIFWFLRLEGVISAPKYCGKCKAAAVPCAFNRDEGGWLCKKCRKEGGFLVGAETVRILNDVFAKPPGDLKLAAVEPFPKELETMLYFNIYHFLGSDLKSLRIGM
jgi:DNA repair protein RecO (recombination protein O)